MYFYSKSSYLITQSLSHITTQLFPENITNSNSFTTILHVSENSGFQRKIPLQERQDSWRCDIPPYLSPGTSDRNAPTPHRYTKPDSISSTDLLVSESAHSIPKLHRDLMSWKTKLGRSAQARTALVSPAAARRHQQCPAASGSGPVTASAAQCTHARDSTCLPSTLSPLFFLRSRIIF